MELRRTAQDRHEGREAFNVFPVNLDELEHPLVLFVHQMMRRLDQRGFSHAPRPPQQRIVGRQALGKASRIFQQGIARLVDALEQLQVNPIHFGNCFKCGR